MKLIELWHKQNHLEPMTDGELRELKYKLQETLEFLNYINPWEIYLGSEIERLESMLNYREEL